MTLSIEESSRTNGERKSSRCRRQLWRRSLAACATAILMGGNLTAAEHIVPAARLHDAVAKRQTASRENKAELLRLLSRPEAQTALASAGMEFRRVEQAVALLDDESAARLAQRARTANQDFAAGALSNQMLTYIVIALGAAVIVLIAVS